MEKVLDHKKLLLLIKRTLLKTCYSPTKMWISLRNCENLRHIPSWTGFFIKLHKDVSINPSKVDYLDCLNAPATEMSTIYHMMGRALRIKSQLNLQSIVCVYDQAIYAKAYQIKCKETMKCKHAFLFVFFFMHFFSGTK